MSRFARERRVFFIEEADRTDICKPGLRLHVCDRSQVRVVTVLTNHTHGTNFRSPEEPARSSPF
jgi:hypothetical protein